MASEVQKRKLSSSDNLNNGDVSKKLKCEDSKCSGVLLFSGLSDYELRNDKDLMKSDALKWSPHRYQTLDGIKIHTVSSGSVSYFFYAVSDEGRVYSCGLNAKGQLGHDDLKNRRNPCLIESLKDHQIESVATGRQHGLFLTKEGIVFSCGDNKNGQCGIGNKKEVVTVPTPINYTGPPIVQIACGGEFSLILNEDGVVFSFGLPEYGQLGLGSENKEISARKEVFHCEYSPVPLTSFVEVDPDEGGTIFLGKPKITKIACGVNHCCAIDDKQRLFTWGFGGYGRLGHNDTKNELVPRLMKCWYRITGRADGGITNVFCGQQFTIVQTIVPKCALLFGQQATNKEANMYPKFIDDLNGWDVKHISCNQSGYIVCADDKVIASQPSPCYGTLAMGPTVKSSAAPKIITTLKDVVCFQTGVGYMHSLYLVRCEKESDLKAIENFPIVKFEDSNEAKNIPDKSKPEKKKTAAKKKPAAKVKKGKK
ncbi:protein RCC2 [Hydra vulgaris]|uniref:Protein RCC2 n=1 Tax=Hydra vulgaris TaxID=6087 RepID=A0ABM4BM80_HYDVU